MVLGKKTSSLIFFSAALHIGRDALHRDPSPSEGPFSDPTASSRKSISVFSVSRAERVVNPYSFVFSFFSDQIVFRVPVQVAKAGKSRPFSSFL